MTRSPNDSRKIGKSLVWAGASLIVVLLAVTAYQWHGYYGLFAGKGAPAEKLTIAVNAIPLSAPVWIALDRGYFKQEGLDVTLESFVSGKEALASALAGKADVATVAETPIMQTVMAGGKIRILATISDSEKITAIVARKDRGILRPQDMEGKIFGVTPGTNSQYLLNTFLLFHGIAANRTKMVPLRPDQMKDAMLSGRVDAVSIWEPLLSDIRNALGPKGEIYYATGFYRMTWNLVARPDFVAQRPKAITKMLRALIRAEHFIIEKPDQALLLVTDRVGLRKEELAPIWKDYYFRVSLDQSLLINLENQAHWAMANKLVPGTKVPNFLETIYADGLKSVRPDAVTVGG
jgi:ABC-type nitrate/sulfonate/bicarbonate transport system substrate-binding protein